MTCENCGESICVCPPLEEIISNLNDETTDPDRPMQGQQPKRSVQYVTLRVRDLKDCMLLGLVDCVMADYADKYGWDSNEYKEMSRRVEDRTFNYNDIYEFDFSKMDPIAAIQCFGCRVEKQLDIFPNLLDGEISEA